MTSVCRYHAAASDPVARQAIVHDNAALGGGVAPLAVARSAGSNFRVSPGGIATVTVPFATRVAPLGSAGWSGIGGSEAPAGSVGLLEPEGLGTVGRGVAVADVVEADGRAVVGAAEVDDAAVAVGAAVVGVGVVRTTAALPVARGVGVAAMRSVSVHAAAMHSATTMRRTRIYPITARTRPARCAHGHAGTAAPLSGSRANRPPAGSSP
jgi:hypothetical protein